MIVRRPGEDEREVLDEGVIDTVLPGVSDGKAPESSSSSVCRTLT